MPFIQSNISLVIKILFTFFIIILVPIYWKNYGPQNFLWLSDIGLFLTLFALWLESPLLISIAVVGILPVELAWNIDFFTQLLTGYNLLGIANYMFESKYTILLKGLSLFHIFVPILWIWYLFKLGYDEQAINYTIALVSIVLILTYFLTDPKKNINWVFATTELSWIPPVLWLLILIIGSSLLVFWPMHELLKRIT